MGESNKKGDPVVTAYDRIKKWRHQTKERLIEAFGGSCGICGYDKSKTALSFHHIDSATKERNFSSKCQSWKSIVKEVRKCVMICCNCHMEVHEGITEIPADIKRFDESFVEYKETFIDECPVCGGPKPTRYKVCSTTCNAKWRYNVEWDEIDLLKMYKEIGSYTGVAKKLKISDKTVSKRIKRLEAGSSNGKMVA